MTVKAVGFVTVVIIGIFTKICLNKSDVSSTPSEPIFNDNGCTLAGMGAGFIGSEDMALGKHGVLFITSGICTQPSHKEQLLLILVECGSWT